MNVLITAIISLLLVPALAWAGEAKKAKIGEELAARALEVLDERVRASQRPGSAQCSEVSELSRQLYRVTAEVAAKLGG